MPKKPYLVELKRMSMEERGAVAKILEGVIIRYAKLSTYLEEKNYPELANYVYGGSMKNVTKTKNLFEGVHHIIPKNRNAPIQRGNTLRNYVQKGNMKQKLLKIDREVKKINNITTP